VVARVRSTTVWWNVGKIGCVQPGVEKFKRKNLFASTLTRRHEDADTACNSASGRVGAAHVAEQRATGAGRRMKMKDMMREIKGLETTS